jgi:hypothetical protein
MRWRSPVAVLTFKGAGKIEALVHQARAAKAGASASQQP